MGGRFKDVTPWGQSHAPSPAPLDPAVGTVQDRDPGGEGPVGWRWQVPGHGRNGDAREPDTHLGGHDG